MDQEPQKNSSDIPSPPPVPPDSGAVRKESAAPRSRKPILLVVDDEENFREITSVKFSSEGFEVVTAKDGAEALLTLEKVTPDLVLMDINMPGETGTDVALAMKQNPKTSNVRIAFLTSLKEPWPAMVGDRKKISQELGMEDFLEKTEDLNVLVKKVKSILGLE